MLIGLELEADTNIDKQLDTLCIVVLVGIFQAVEIGVVESSLLIAVGHDVLLVEQVVDVDVDIQTRAACQIDQLTY